jgi:mannose-6-phosphate isomerase-like protein (cupin superfamily)
MEQGDCIYIPAYWWHQIETPANKPTIALSYWYEVSSEWLKIVFQGLENNQI